MTSAWLWMSDFQDRCSFLSQGGPAFPSHILGEDLETSWTKSLHPEDLPSCLAAYHQARQTHSPFAVEYRVSLKSGEILWLLDVGVSQWTAEGNFAGYTGICLEITDRKNRETDLEEGNHSGENLVSPRKRQTPDFSGAVQTNKLHPVQRISDKQDLLMDETTTGRPQSDRSPALSLYLDLESLNTGNPPGGLNSLVERLESSKRVAKFEGNRAQRALLRSPSRWRIAPSASPWGTLSYALKQVREQLQEPQPGLATSIESESVGLVNCGPDGSYLRVNQRFCEIVGYSAEELLQRRFQDITHPDDLADNLMRRQACLTSHQRSFSMQKRYIRKDGVSIWVNLKVVLAQREGEDSAYDLAGVTDITDAQPATKAVPESEIMVQWVMENFSQALVYNDATKRRPEGHPFNEPYNKGHYHNSPNEAVEGLSEPENWLEPDEDFTSCPSLEAELNATASRASALESARRLFTVIETVGEGITLSDSAGNFEIYNSKMQEITGYSREEAEVSGDFLRLLYPDPQAYAEALQGVNDLLSLGGTREVETVIVAKDGTQKTLLVSTTLVQYESEVSAFTLHSDSRCWFLSAYRDISQRVESQEALRQAEEKYRGLFENALEGIFQTTADGHYLNANPALARIYGYASPQELMRHLTDIERQLYVDPNRRAEFAHRLQQDGAVSHFESQVYRADGSIIWISENARAVRDRFGELLYYEGTVEDITERKRAEEERRQQAERERLTAKIAQRIRQSLNLNGILKTAVTQVRQFLHADRVLICRFGPEGSRIVAESVGPEWQPPQEPKILDACLVAETTAVTPTALWAVEDIYTANLPACYVNV